VLTMKSRFLLGLSRFVSLTCSKYSPTIPPWREQVFSLKLSKYGALVLYILGNIRL
jgi:hypothetical protein